MLIDTPTSAANAGAAQAPSSAAHRMFLMLMYSSSQYSPGNPQRDPTQAGSIGGKNSRDVRCDRLLGRDGDSCFDRVESNGAIGLIGIVLGSLAGKGHGVCAGR